MCGAWLEPRTGEHAMNASDTDIIETADPIQAVRAFFERLSRNCAAVDYDATEPLFADDVASFGT